MTDTYPQNATPGDPDEALIGEDAPVADVEEAPPPTDDQLSRVTALAREQVKLIQEVNFYEAKLADAQERLRRNEEVDLPAAMTQVGMTDFGLRNGARVEVKDAVNASIPKDAQSDGHDWLEAHGHRIVKRRIEIFFSKEDVAWAKKFLADCARRKRPLELSVKEWVEPQTLGKLVRELLAQAKATGQDPEVLAPSKTLGVFHRTYARVSGPGVPQRAKKKGATPPAATP